MDAIHQRPPSTLQLVHLLAQLLNLFGQAALWQADPVWGGGQGGTERGERDEEDGRVGEKQQKARQSTKPRPMTQLTPDSVRVWSKQKVAAGGQGWGQDKGRKDLRSRPETLTKTG